MSSDDRLFGAFAALVRAVMSKVDFLALYPARAVSQNGDGTLEVVPDDKRIPGMSRVPIRYGLPGVKVTLKKDARILLGFEGGDPQKPAAMVWESGTLDKLTIEASAEVKVAAPKVTHEAGHAKLAASGGKPVARKGDGVESLLEPLTCQITLPAGPNTGSPAPATITFLPLMPLKSTIVEGNPDIDA